MATLYSDNFNRADETPLNTGTWGQSGTGSFNLASNQVSHPADANDNEVYYVAATAFGDQFSQARMTGLGGSGGEIGCGLVCRHIGTATRTFIRAVVDDAGAGNAQVTVRSFTAGAGTLVGSRTFAFSVGDTIRLEVTGTSPNIVARVLKNGVQQGADFTGVSGPNTGKPGLCYSSTPAAIATLDDWEAGDFSVPGPSVTLPTPPLPRAFQEQGRIYSGEQTGFQPLGFQIPDPGRAFQEGTRLGEPRAFQDQAFQIPDPGVAFQPEAFDDLSAFQMSVLAFQELTGYQGDAFQETLRQVAAVEIERQLQILLQAVNRSSVW